MEGFISSVCWVLVLVWYFLVLLLVLVWYFLVLPSETHAVANMTSMKPIDGNTSYHSYEPFPLQEKVKMFKTCPQMA